MKKIVLFLLVALLLYGCGSSTPTETNKTEIENNGDMFSTLDMGVVEALVDMGYTQENADSIRNTLSSVGIVGIKLHGNIKGDPNIDEIHMSLYPNGHVDDKYIFDCTTKGGDVTLIEFSGETLYDSASGGFKMMYGSVHVAETEIDLWMKSELTDFIKKSAKEISSFPATVKIKYWTLEFAREDNFYEVSCVYSSKNALGLSLERELKMFCEVIEDGTMIRANEVYLDGKRIK